MSEEWRDCSGFTKYAVSNFGRVKNKKTKRILKPGIVGGYEHYKFVKNDKSVNVAGHRLVTTAFLPNPGNKPCVDHIDNDPQNNNLTNLRWVTHSENSINRNKVYGAVPFRGVARHLHKYQAHISVDGTAIHLGLFDTPEEAHEMYDAVARGFYGEFYVSKN